MTTSTLIADINNKRKEYYEKLVVTHLVVRLRHLNLACINKITEHLHQLKLNFHVTYYHNFPVIRIPFHKGKEVNYRQYNLEQWLKNDYINYTIEQEFNYIDIENVVNFPTEE